MPRAIIISANAEPEWITLDGSDIVGDLRTGISRNVATADAQPANLGGA